MSDKLEACPFCGGEAFLNHPHNGAKPFVMCGQCNACGPQSEAAVVGWTLRTPTPEQAGEGGADSIFEAAMDNMEAVWRQNGLLDADMPEWREVKGIAPESYEMMRQAMHEAIRLSTPPALSTEVQSGATAFHESQVSSKAAQPTADAVERAREALEPFAVAADKCDTPIAGSAARWLTWEDFARANRVFAALQPGAVPDGGGVSAIADRLVNAFIATRTPAPPGTPDWAAVRRSLECELFAQAVPTILAPQPQSGEAGA